MDGHAWLAAMHLIGCELCARTANDHNPLIRFARRTVGITGDPITGYRPVNA